MIVDYNYKPFVALVTLSSSVDTVYTPPSKNNKGFICIAGHYSGTQTGPKSLSFYGTDGSIIQVPTLNTSGLSIVLTGSLNDFYMQFSREDVNAYDINFIRQATFKSESCFFPIVYQSITFPPVATALTRPTIVITLY
jgi:hypothetical protein